MADIAGSNVKYALVDSDPQLADYPFESRARLCYAWDRGMVEDADLVIAEASYPSIGLGIEMQLAEQAGIPIILCFKDDAAHRAGAVTYANPDSSRHELQIGEGYVSLMALGVPKVVKVIKYTKRADGIGTIVQAVRTVAGE